MITPECYCCKMGFPLEYHPGYGWFHLTDGPDIECTNPEIIDKPNPEEGLLEFSKGGLVGKCIQDGKVHTIIEPGYLLPEHLIQKYGNRFMEALNCPNSEDSHIFDLFKSLTHKGNTMTTGITELQEKIQAVIESTDWDQFKSQKTLVPTIEIKALLINAVKESKKIITSIMADSINDKEEE